MNVKPIKHESDYDAALAEIAHLMDAEPNTPEGDRLDILVDVGGSLRGEALAGELT